MLTALAPLGADHHIAITLVYDGGNVTATILARPKKDDKAVTPIQFEGPVAEVEEAIKTQLADAVNDVVKSSSNLAELKQQMKDNEAAETKKVTDKKDAKKPAPAKVVPKKGGGKAKTPAKADEDDEPAETNETPGEAKSATTLLEDI